MATCTNGQRETRTRSPMDEFSIMGMGTRGNTRLIRSRNEGINRGDARL